MALDSLSGQIITDDLLADCSPSEIDNFIDITADSLRTTLDLVGPLKKLTWN